MDLQIPSITQYQGPYKTSEEYVIALREWLSQMYQIQCLHAGFPYFLAAAMQKQHQQPGMPIHGSTLTSSPVAGATSSSAQNTSPQRVERGREYLVPSLWKRFLAESIDFMLLFTIKLVITYLAIDFLDLFDMENYNLETLRADMLSDYRLTMNVTWDIFLLESIHRVLNCVFEALCLHRDRRGQGGATPGKKLMGLRVVRCEWVVPTLNNQVLVYPAADLGLWRSFTRAVAKNITITLMFPMCVTFFMYHNNRMLYDVMAGSLVVEDIPLLRRTPNNDNNNNNNNNNNNHGR
ncbi:protein FAM8A1 isoform X2 [Hyalella azteca]|uniref:Protein FAM8A1 isoform X2 n=1 Tax=Hyalella azteca TaxID=294128 RepID=A0A8B7NKY5_HYAAZ|nr:protein FAM8A1 isoform X2 [Hyalella azteca]